MTQIIPRTKNNSRFFPLPSFNSPLFSPFLTPFFLLRYNLPRWLKKRVNIEDVANFHGIIPTPDIGYRNKIQFAIATEGFFFFSFFLFSSSYDEYNSDFLIEGKPMVGYTQGQQRLDNLQICDPKDCKNTPQEAIVVREIVQVCFSPLFPLFSNF